MRFLIIAAGLLHAALSYAEAPSTETIAEVQRFTQLHQFIQEASFKYEQLDKEGGCQHFVREYDDHRVFWSLEPLNTPYCEALRSNINEATVERNTLIMTWNLRRASELSGLTGKEGRTARSRIERSVKKYSYGVSASLIVAIRGKLYPPQPPMSASAMVPRPQR